MESTNIRAPLIWSMLPTKYINYNEINKDTFSIRTYDLWIPIRNYLFQKFTYVSKTIERLTPSYSI
jgi:hypothetical protein